jgi:prophage antirepressor-like protein
MELTAAIQPFFFNGAELRFVGTVQRPEWVANDLLEILYPELDKRNRHNYLNKVPAKWKGHKNLMTLGGEQNVVTLLEPGFWRIIARSDSPLAIPFQDWLFEEVLPTIRRTGSYSISGDRTNHQLIAQIAEMRKEMALISRQVGAKPPLVIYHYQPPEITKEHVAEVAEAIALTVNPQNRIPVIEIWRRIEAYYQNQGILQVRGEKRIWKPDQSYIKGSNQVFRSLKLLEIPIALVDIGSNRKGIKGIGLK